MRFKVRQNRRNKGKKNRKDEKNTSGVLNKWSAGIVVTHEEIILLFCSQ